jgi:hypothetical protein
MRNQTKWTIIVLGIALLIAVAFKIFAPPPTGPVPTWWGI